MKSGHFDREIKSALECEAKQYEASEAMLEKIMKNIETGGTEVKMRKFNMKKTAIVAAAAIMLIGTVCYAGGKAVNFYSSSNARPDYTRYEDLEKAEAKAGVSAYAPESFLNGYEFKGINVINNKDTDEDGNAVAKYQSLCVRYARGAEAVSFFAEPLVRANEDADLGESYEKNGITYHCHELSNKFVPVDYVPTPEEEKAVAEGTLNIGYGASDISCETSRSVTWTYNGATYKLFAMDSDLSITCQELYEMALEIMETV